VRRPAQGPKRDFAVLSFLAWTKWKPGKSEGTISPSETDGFARGSQVLEIIRGSEIDHFAELCIFNDLIPFSFRRESRAPTSLAGKAAGGRSYDGRARACRDILKNGSRRSPVRQENVDFLGRPPSTGRPCGGLPPEPPEAFDANVLRKRGERAPSGLSGAFLILTVDADQIVYTLSL
jgi:hypothetical protein